MGDDRGLMELLLSRTWRKDHALPLTPIFSTFRIFRPQHSRELVATSDQEIEDSPLRRAKDVLSFVAASLEQLHVDCDMLLRSGCE